jgi:ankyrin repeat protein
MMASQLPNNSGIRCVEVLVQHPISADVNLRGRHGRSALHFAAEFNNGGVLNLLLDKGAELNAKDSNGDTPLMMAAANNKEDAARELISKKAQLFTRNVKGCTAMSIAQDKKSREVVRLLEHAADK